MVEIAFTRRQTLQALAGATCGLAFGRLPALAAAARTLRVETRTLEILGRAATVYGIRQPDGTAGLTLAAGEAFDVTVENGLDEPTLVHWHGLTPPWRQDGVPGLTAPALQPGERARYQFPQARTGTHWMHSHDGLQEQRLMAAPLIVREASAKRADEQEVVIMLHDFSFAPPEELLRGLEHGGHGAPAGGHGGHAGHGAPAAHNPNDIEFDAYLANDRTLDDPEVVAVEAGGRVRLRIINGAAATNFTIDLGLLTGALIAVDGNPIVPLSGRRFPIAMGQRLDIRLDLPRGGKPSPVLALREGGVERAGVLLAPRGATVARLAVKGAAPGPILDQSLTPLLSAVAPPAARKADRTLRLDLVGDMAGYRWGLVQPGVADGAPLQVRHGERVEVVMTNRTPMSHPMHLHGHHFQVVGLNAARIAGALRDTVLVPVGHSVTIAFDADNAGRWAFHCHHLYHMAAGMMTVLDYDGVS